MIKIAMVNIDDAIRKNQLKSSMLLQVHDELVFEVRKSEETALKSLVEERMRAAMRLSVPIEVDIGVGQTWFEAH